MSEHTVDNLIFETRIILQKIDPTNMLPYSNKCIVNRSFAKFCARKIFPKLALHKIREILCPQKSIYSTYYRPKIVRVQT